MTRDTLEPKRYVVRVKQKGEWVTVYDGSDRPEAWRVLTAPSAVHTLACMSEAPEARP